jgi:transcriptional regulator with XRE-family HTH domain
MNAVAAIPQNSAADTLAALGSAIRARREKLGLTQARLGSLANLSRATINELESGQLTDLGIGKVMRLLDIIGFSISLAPRRNMADKPARRGLALAARTASTSYRHDLPPTMLAEALRSGRIPVEYRAHFATLLDEAPIPVVVRAVEESFSNAVPKGTWRNIAKWAVDFKSTRDIWH